MFKQSTYVKPNPMSENQSAIKNPVKMFLAHPSRTVFSEVVKNKRILPKLKKLNYPDINLGADLLSPNEKRNILDHLSECASIQINTDYATESIVFICHNLRDIARRDDSKEARLLLNLITHEIQHYTLDEWVLKNNQNAIQLFETLQNELSKNEIPPDMTSKTAKCLMRVIWLEKIINSTIDEQK